MPAPTVADHENAEASLSSAEVAMDLIRVIRARGLKSLAQVKEVYSELFPEHAEEERARHLRFLATKLCANMTPAEMREARRRHPGRR